MAVVQDSDGGTADERHKTSVVKNCMISI